MSYVTTVIVFGRYIPDKAQAVLESGYHDGERQVSFGNLSHYTPTESCDTWRHWGGTKGPNADLFGGAFNFLDSEALKGWLSQVPWYGRVFVVVAHEEGVPETWSFGEGSDAEDYSPSPDKGN
jgi:hypothetical protein